MIANNNMITDVQEGFFFSRTSIVVVFEIQLPQLLCLVEQQSLRGNFTAFVSCILGKNSYGIVVNQGS